MCCCSLSKSLSRPSDRAIRLGRLVKLCALGLFFLGLLRLLSFSFWSFVLDLVTALYLLSLQRAHLADRDRVVPLNVFISVLLLLSFDVISCAGSIASLATNTWSTLLSLKAWQNIAGLVIGSIALFVYLVTLGVFILLYRDLRTTELYVPGLNEDGNEEDEETLSFLRENVPPAKHQALPSTLHSFKE
ncbi:hypothetical protein BASA81_010559 [Batrachochytrium salamandrivorans]|nr:hypothetical protein BASA81_010559 [Batrachochytrium salamandrivorans]